MKTTGGLKVRTGIKAGAIYGWSPNHNEAMVRGLKVRTGIQAGRLATNHNEAMA